MFKGLTSDSHTIQDSPAFSVPAFYSLVFSGPVFSTPCKLVLHFPALAYAAFVLSFSIDPRPRLFVIFYIEGER